MFKGRNILKLIVSESLNVRAVQVKSGMPGIETLKAEGVRGPMTYEHETFSQEVPGGLLFFGINITFSQDP